MFDKKIVLLISLLLVTGSSYIIFHRKKDNDDEVNIVDNSDNSINDDANEEESINDAESSSSFLKYFFLFIIIIIVAIIMFFAVKKIIKKKKKTSNEEKPIEIKKNIKNDVNPNNTNPKNNTDNKNNTEENKENDKNKPPEENKYSEEFKRYFKYKIGKEPKVVTPEGIEDLIKRIIGSMGQDCWNYINEANLNLEDYDTDNFLIDFYFKPDSKNKGTMEINIKDNETRNLILKNNNKRVCEISVEKNKEIIQMLFNTLFGEITSYEYLFQKFIQSNYKPDDVETNKEKINSFFFNIIDPFLECVSKRENKDIKFISEPNKIRDDFKYILKYLLSVEEGYYPDDQKQNKKLFLSDLSDPKSPLFDYFVKVFNDLINYYFPESKHLNEIKYKI